ncbi:hypothetical protein NON00_10020 [Roseomonas sp. GC11]|uniref:hypothetical protein n=1 Tax=Roseomonas sp. GC11 TaxID=2950546 RepID=UPI00210E83D6|nr:hypothetical protein [Roseomonas sp. GC11]MCQ4160263.1 hypothetical protein [Roseomonas sp. GC11]
MTMAALAYALGARVLAAWLGLCVLATVPLLAVGPLLQWRSRQSRTRRHRQRAAHFSQG